MSKFIKENWKILLSFLIIIILFPIFILVPSPVGFIPKDIGLQIIGYGGSIFGGFLTLYGVWWTIKDNEKQRKENLDNQNFPIPMFDVITTKNKELISNLYTIDKPIYGEDDSKNKVLLIKLYIYNIKEIDIFDLYCVQIQLEVFTNNNKVDLRTLKLPKGNNKLTKIIPSNSKIITEFLIEITNNEIMQKIINEKLFYNVHMFFRYYNKYHIQHSLEVVLHFDHLEIQDNTYFANSCVIHIEKIQ